MVETCEVYLQILHVLGPRHLIDTRRGSLLQTEEARPQYVDADVMQERSQLTLFVPGNGVSYAGLRSEMPCSERRSRNEMALQNMRRQSAH
jgi:hypothetical protein